MTTVPFLIGYNWPDRKKIGRAGQTHTGHTRDVAKGYIISLVSLFPSIKDPGISSVI